MRSRFEQILTADIAEVKAQLAAALEQIAALTAAVQAPPRRSWTRRELMARHHLSETQFHELDRRVPLRRWYVGPQTYRATNEAEDEWLRELEAAGQPAPREAAE
jgi:hypothetical protein